MFGTLGSVIFLVNSFWTFFIVWITLIFEGFQRGKQYSALLQMRDLQRVIIVSTHLPVNAPSTQYPSSHMLGIPCNLIIRQLKLYLYYVCDRLFWPAHASTIIHFRICFEGNRYCLGTVTGKLIGANMSKLLEFIQLQFLIVCSSAVNYKSIYRL